MRQDDTIGKPANHNFDGQDSRDKKMMVKQHTMVVILSDVDYELPSYARKVASWCGRW